MANDFLNSLLSMFGAAPAPRNVIDTRSREGVATDQMRANQSNQLQDQYTQASNNPNYGIGTPAEQALQEQTLANDIRNRTGASGGSGSGYEGDQIRKAIVDYRINAMGKRQQYLDSLRQGMLTASNPMPRGTQDSTNESPFRTAASAAIGGFGARLGNQAADNMFGPQGGNNPSGATKGGEFNGGGQAGDPAHGFRVDAPPPTFTPQSLNI